MKPAGSEVSASKSCFRGASPRSASVTRHVEVALLIERDADGLIELARRNKLVVKMEETSPQKKRGGLMAQLLSVAAAALLQGGLKIASSQLSHAMSGMAHHSNGRPGVHHE